MAIRRSKSEDYIGPSKGAMKWVNNFFRFILFPFIHPLFFIMLLVVIGGMILGVHHFVGVAYKDIPMWLVNYNVKYFDDIAEKYNIVFLKNITTKLNKALNNTSEPVNNEIKIANTVANNSQTYSGRKAFYDNSNTGTVTTKTVGRQAFKNIQKPSAKVENYETEEETAKAVVAQKREDLFAIKYDNSLGYTYTKQPRVIKGEIFVVNVNEIKINGEQMFLYGIYNEPTSDVGMRGALYLQNIVKGKESECRVVAFTENAELTAVCVTGDVNINRKLLDMGFSKNISLR